MCTVCTNTISLYGNLSRHIHTSVSSLYLFNVCLLLLLPHSPFHLMLGHSIAEYTAIRTRSSRKRDGSWNQHGPEWLCLCACVCVSAERNAAGKCHENRFQQNMFTVCASAFDYVCVCVCAYLCICVGYTLSSEIEFSLSLTVNRIGRETLFCREREWYRLLFRIGPRSFVFISIDVCALLLQAKLIEKVTATQFVQSELP